MHLLCRVCPLRLVSRSANQVPEKKNRQIEFYIIEIKEFFYTDRKNRPPVMGRMDMAVLLFATRRPDVLRISIQMDHEQGCLANVAKSNTLFPS